MTFNAYMVRHWRRSYESHIILDFKCSTLPLNDKRSLLGGVSLYKSEIDWSWCNAYILRRPEGWHILAILGEIVPCTWQTNFYTSLRNRFETATKICKEYKYFYYPSPENC